MSTAQERLKEIEKDLEFYQPVTAEKIMKRTYLKLEKQGILLGLEENKKLQALHDDLMENFKRMSENFDRVKAEGRKEVFDEIEKKFGDKVEHLCDCKEWCSCWKDLKSKMLNDILPK